MQPVSAAWMANPPDPVMLPWNTNYQPSEPLFYSHQVQFPNSPLGSGILPTTGESAGTSLPQQPGRGYRDSLVPEPEPLFALHSNSPAFWTSSVRPHTNRSSERNSTSVPFARGLDDLRQGSRPASIPLRQSVTHDMWVASRMPMGAHPLYAQTHLPAPYGTQGGSSWQATMSSSAATDGYMLSPNPPPRSPSQARSGGSHRPSRSGVSCKLFVAHPHF